MHGTVERSGRDEDVDARAGEVQRAQNPQGSNVLCLVFIRKVN